jgi:ubiquinone/menaquinone biosynthesis C-methylase UbiE
MAAWWNGAMENPLEKHGRFFDVWSRFYRLGPLGLELRRIQRQAIERLRLTPGQRVLDLGCGPADGTVKLRHLGAEGIGLDYSAGMLAAARREPSLQGRLCRGDAGRLPFRDAAFDKVICTNSFHHYPDHRSALREVRRVLKPGGLLVLVDPRRDNLFGRIAIDLFENAIFGLHEVRIFSVPEWYALLREAGFSDARVETGPVWRPTAWAEVFVEATA